MKRTLVALAGTLLFVALAAPAYAQTSGYPTGPPGACPFPTIVDLGTHNVGDTFAGSVGGTNGGFTPGALASIVLNNLAAGTKVVDARGCINTTHQILSGPRDNVDDVVAANCGSNQLVATQDGHVGRIDFRINCVAAAAAGR